MRRHDRAADGFDWNASLPTGADTGDESATAVACFLTVCLPRCHSARRSFGEIVLVNRAGVKRLPSRPGFRFICRPKKRRPLHHAPEAAKRPNPSFIPLNTYWAPVGKNGVSIR
jgi:hypothetical protein